MMCHKGGHAHATRQRYQHTQILVKKGVKGQQGQQIALNYCNGRNVSLLTVVLTVGQGSAKGQQRDGVNQVQGTFGDLPP